LTVVGRSSEALTTWGRDAARMDLEIVERNMVGQVKGVSWVANGDGSPLAPSLVILMTLRGFPQEPIRGRGARGVAKQEQTAVPETFD